MLDCLYSPFTKFTCIQTFSHTHTHSLLWSSFSELSEMLPQIKLNSRNSHLHFSISQLLQEPWGRDPEWISVLCLNSVRIQSPHTSRGPLCPSASLGSPEELQCVSPGSRMSCYWLMVLSFIRWGKTLPLKLGSGRGSWVVQFRHLAGYP